MEQQIAEIQDHMNRFQEEHAQLDQVIISDEPCKTQHKKLKLS
jgi:hypothetical protein